jgi:hypothetical protein
MLDRRPGLLFLQFWKTWKTIKDFHRTGRAANEVGDPGQTVLAEAASNSE